MKHYARRLLTDPRLVARTHRAMFALGVLCLTLSVSAMALRMTAG